MNELNKDLGIKLKPFCVRSDEFPSAQICQDMLDHCVTKLGAKAVVSVRETIQECQYARRYDLCLFKTPPQFWGVTKDYQTLTFNDTEIHQYGCELLTYKEMLDYLQLTEKDGRLVPNEELKGTPEAPVSSSKPVSMIKGKVVEGNLERLLELIVGEFRDGDNIRYTHGGGIVRYSEDCLLSDVIKHLHVLMNSDWSGYCLNSEYKRAIIDKLIKEAENDLLEAQQKLDELKKQRGTL